MIQGTDEYARVQPTLRAADQVACEFDQHKRVDYLAQVVREEIPGIDYQRSRDIARLFVDFEASP